MNCSGGERGNGLTLFDTGLLAFSGDACGGEGAKRNAMPVGLKGNAVVRGLKRGMRGRVHLCLLMAD